MILELLVINMFQVGPTYSIIEEKNVPGEIILQIHRESGKFYFHSFTFGMYHIGGYFICLNYISLFSLFSSINTFRAYDEYIEMYDAKEGENITFHPNKDVPLYNYEFKVFGEMSEGVICTLCTLGKRFLIFTYLDVVFDFRVV